MKPLHLNGRDEEEETAEPARDRRSLPSEPRSSGVYARRERAPDDGGGGALAAIQAAGPCHTFADVYRRYAGFVWSRIQRPNLRENDARDVFQKVWMTIQSRLGAGLVPDGVGFVILAVIANQLRNHARERRRRERVFTATLEGDDMPSSKPDPETLMVRSEAREEAKQKVVALLAQLPERWALVFRLIEIDGLSREEVASRIDRNLAVVDVLLHRARARFSELAAQPQSVPGGSK
jgi:RNA polymerase sigma factor (sigma-70 family)